MGMGFSRFRHTAKNYSRLLHVTIFQRGAEHKAPFGKGRLDAPAALRESWIKNIPPLHWQKRDISTYMIYYNVIVTALSPIRSAVTESLPYAVPSEKLNINV